MAKTRSESERERTMETLLSESQKVREIVGRLKERMKRATKEEIAAGYIEQDVTQEIENPAVTEQSDVREEKIATYFDSLWSFLQQTRIQALADLDSGLITEEQFEIRIAATAKVWEDRLKAGIKDFGAELVGKVLNENPNIS